MNFKQHIHVEMAKTEDAKVKICTRPSINQANQISVSSTSLACSIQPSPINIPSWNQFFQEFQRIQFMQINSGLILLLDFLSIFIYVLNF